LASRQEQFASLVETYSRVVSAAIRRVCAHRFRSLIPDIQQEVYAALWKHLEGGKEIEHPASYLYKVALTTALALVRKQVPEDPIDAADAEISQKSTGFAGLLPAERSRLLAEVLEQLPRDQSRAIRAHLAGFSHTEVASLFGWTESVARHRIYRGIEELKQRLKGTLHARVDTRPA
jgi:RNA polymerase sigma-70 factor (ECF subfamily)